MDHHQNYITVKGTTKLSRTLSLTKYLNQHNVSVVHYDINSENSYFMWIPPAHLNEKVERLPMSEYRYAKRQFFPH